ncbi:MAG: 16S rRNA (guanine(966)-N(2))-methyltransferase RsmD [Janthinobacterium lividum]
MIMRIIAGKWRRCLIKMPDLGITRPTSDRLRETIFNVLNAYLLKNNRSFEDMRVADIFAGSGALGLEALSRGAKQATFIEQNYAASQILQQNIASLQANSQCHLIVADAFSLDAPQVPYDLIFLDPPYSQGLIERMLVRLEAQKWLSPQGSVVIEAKITDNVKISDNWQIYDDRTSGIAAFWLISLKKPELRLRIQIKDAF